MSARTAGNAGDLFRAHFQHWTTLPILVYRLMWVLVGLRSYTPYQVLIVSAHLVAAALLARGDAPRRCAALAGDGRGRAFVFFGAGAENILVAFQITFVGALVFGLAQLLLSDHDGPIDRRDWLGLLAGFAGLACSGVAMTMTVVVGLAVLPAPWAARLARSRCSTPRRSRSRTRCGRSLRRRGRTPRTTGVIHRCRSRSSCWSVSRPRSRGSVRCRAIGIALGIVLVVGLIVCRSRSRAGAPLRPARGADRAARGRRPVPGRHRCRTGRPGRPARARDRNRSRAGPRQPLRVPRRGDGDAGARARRRRAHPAMAIPRGSAGGAPRRRAAGQHPPTRDTVVEAAKGSPSCGGCRRSPTPPRRRDPRHAPSAAGQQLRDSQRAGADPVPALRPGGPDLRMAGQRGGVGQDPRSRAAQPVLGLDVRAAAVPGARRRRHRRCMCRPAPKRSVRELQSRPDDHGRTRQRRSSPTCRRGYAVVARTVQAVDARCAGRAHATASRDRPANNVGSKLDR